MRAPSSYTHQSAIGATTSACSSSGHGRPPRNPGPPIHVNGTSSIGQPCETFGTVIEPWPMSQLVVQNQIWSPPW